MKKLDGALLLTTDEYDLIVRLRLVAPEARYDYIELSHAVVKLFPLAVRPNLRLVAALK